MIENMKEITMETIVGEVSKLKSDGQRLVTLSCTELDADNFDIIYTFDKELVLTHLRVTIPKGTNCPSISGVYFTALLVENEIQDQFGLLFDGLILDFGRTLYLDEEITIIPLCNNTKAMTVKK
ncbi:ech hydrogenase subunit D [Desulfovibrio gilichinskyi]|uniref:Ech hydrogenase subunit D n=2 Tax=Desulfovibrio gilichinskyi TaxID=1519643 RepID=A0A1X7DFZ2_9BACT|nr:ech hydrogenase subunit D [Desulfovibrio gilichinskyi]